MVRGKKCLALLLVTLLLVSFTSTFAEGISTTVVMRVSRMTRNAIVNVGEDLSLEVNIEGEIPASYQWYFEGTAIPGADKSVYNIVNAQLEDSGVYRMDAFNAEGRMLVSMEIRARVIDDSIPKSGDNSMPVWVAGIAFISAAGVMVYTLRGKRRSH